MSELEHKHDWQGLGVSSEQTATYRGAAAVQVTAAIFCKECGEIKLESKRL